MPIKVKIPGSKSMTNRLLMLGSLANETITLQNAAICDDTMKMIEGLKQLGKKIDQTNDIIQIHKDDIALTNTITAYGSQVQKQKAKPQSTIEINTGNCGTATRFLTAYSTLSNQNILIEGNARMCKRPIEQLTNALNALGANIITTNGCPPIEILAKKLKGGEIEIAGNISSQYISALLMISPFLEGDYKIDVKGEPCSIPYVEMTLKLMEKFKLKVLNNNFIQFEIKGNQTATPPSVIEIESDCSSASYIGAFAALNPKKEILIEGIHQNSIQGDIKFLEYLEKMGCTISAKESGILIKGPKKLKSLGQVNMNQTPDLVMTFAVLAMFTNGTTKITNIANLKIKETDRLKALENEIKKFGIKVKTGKDFIEIQGNPELEKSAPASIQIETYNDHRIAMSFAILKNKFPNLKIKNTKCVEKSYTNFWVDISKL